MKVFTVTYIDSEDGVFPFVFSYVTRQLAAQAVEAHAVERHEYLVDPNNGKDHKFPGLSWTTAVDKATDVNDGEYWVTETELQT